MYIKWSEDEKVQILVEARRLLQERPRLSKEEAIRAAQLVLPEDRQRRISSINTQAFDWYHKGLLFSEAPAEPEPEPEPEPDDTVNRILDIVLGLDRKLDTKRFEERLADVEKQLRRIYRILEGGFTLVPAGSVTPERPAAVTPPPAETSTASTRKPNVVVLSVPSGNTHGGIRKGTVGYVAKLDFWETPRRPVSFDAYDYVVVTKFTAMEALAELRARVPNGKLRVSTGNAEQISRFIRTLPEIPLR